MIPPGGYRPPPPPHGVSTYNKDQFVNYHIPPPQSHFLSRVHGDRGTLGNASCPLPCCYHRYPPNSTYYYYPNSIYRECVSGVPPITPEQHNSPLGISSSHSFKCIPMFPNHNGILATNEKFDGPPGVPITEMNAVKLPRSVANSGSQNTSTEVRRVGNLAKKRNRKMARRSAVTRNTPGQSEDRVLKSEGATFVDQKAPPGNSTHSIPLTFKQKHPPASTGALGLKKNKNVPRSRAKKTGLELKSASNSKLLSELKSNDIRTRKIRIVQCLDYFIRNNFI